MLTQAIVRIVDLSRRYAWIMALAGLLLTGASSWFAVTHFKINTDVNQLLASDLPWRQHEKELEKAFPQKTDILLVVVEGDTPEAAESAATALTAKLRGMPEMFPYVERPDALPFFRKNGLLFLDKTRLGETLDMLVQAQPLLGAMAADPSLRGLFGATGMMLQGLQAGAVDYDKLDQPFAALADAVQAALNGQDKPLGWQSMMAGGAPDPHELRKLIITKPVLDYGALEPGAAASDIIRLMAQQMNLTPEHGVHVRLTGSVPLNDEEFASVASGTGGATILSIVLVIVILFLALRSPRLIVPILLTLAAGLAATTAVALLAIGSLNLISVAFAVMFIGIAVDFGIQFGVRYRDQHHHEPNRDAALTSTARVVALPLSMAAASTALGFLCFIPTQYRGVSELGFIAGMGMIIAFALGITLLPALLTIFRPPAEPEAIGFAWAAPVDRFIASHRRKILITAIIAAAIGTGIATQLHFDFDPLDLKDPHTESVATMFDLMKDPDFSPYAAEILTPSLNDAQQLAGKLGFLPEVDHTMTLASFVPKDQDAKLAMIADTRTLLEPTLNPPGTMPAPSDAETYKVLRKTAAGLHSLNRDSAERLASALDQVVARRDSGLLMRLRDDLIAGMQAQIAQVRESLGARRVTIDDVPEELRRDWITPDGRALVEAYAKGNPRDYRTLIGFTDAVRKVAPDASGAPISIRESGRTVVGAFIHAGCYALVAIGFFSLLILRRPGDVLRLLAPLLLAGILTLATMVLIGLPLNFANIIALPLLLSLGVSYAIYFVSYWRSGQDKPLQSSVARAVLFSAATTLVAFGTLGLSSHPGTSGMGKLLTVALLYSLACTFFVLPALLGRPEVVKQ